MCGIYCIKVNRCIVYIGQSKDVQLRKRQHIWSMYNSKENKYQLLKGCRKYYPISFWLLEICSEQELNEKEKNWIKLVQPILNSKMNDGNGTELTSQEFYNEVENRIDWVAASEV